MFFSWSLYLNTFFPHTAVYPSSLLVSFPVHITTFKSVWLSHLFIVILHHQTLNSLRPETTSVLFTATPSTPSTVTARRRCLVNVCFNGRGWREDLVIGDYKKGGTVRLRNGSCWDPIYTLGFLSPCSCSSNWIQDHFCMQTLWLSLGWWSVCRSEWKSRKLIRAMIQQAVWDFRVFLVVVNAKL